MTDVAHTAEKDAVAYRVCAECGTHWSGPNEPADTIPIDCPECGGGSVDAEIRAALATIEPWAVEAIRRDERARLSALLKDNAETVGNFAGGGANTARLIAYMVTLGSSSQSIGIEPGPGFNPPDMALGVLADRETRPDDDCPDLWPSGEHLDPPTECCTCVLPPASPGVDHD